MRQSQPRRVGRPPAGARAGEKVKDYPQLSFRLPPEIKSLLNALSLLESKPQWRIMVDAVKCLVQTMPDSKRETLHEIVNRTSR
jgi:predicted DNA-binding protein